MSKKVLRDHQVRAFNDVIMELETNDRTVFVSATGTGKTITLQAIAAKAGHRVVAFFPSIMLVNQTIAEWHIQYGDNFRAIAVCSDETVGQLKKNDNIIVDDSELIQSGAEVTRDPSRIAEILNDKKPVVIFSTYHSANKIASAQLISKESFDVLIADESHYLAGSNPLGKEILDSKKILAKKRVFATATPKVVTLHQTIKSIDREIASMDDVKLFGRESHNFDLRSAINQQVLSDYKIYIVEIKQSEIIDISENLDLSDSETRMAMGIAAYRRMQQDLGVKRSVIYLSSKLRARSFAGSVDNTTVITGEMSAQERKLKLSKLLHDGGAIANVRCLTEGVDLPSLDAVEFVDPRSSKIDIVQAIGRVVRKSPNKEFGYVILPVLEEPFGDDYGSGDTFKPIWEVLAQMSENDTTLQAQIRVSSGYPEEGDEEAASQTDQILHLSVQQKQPQLDDGHDPYYIAEQMAKKIELRSANINNPKISWWEKTIEFSEAKLGKNELIRSSKDNIHEIPLKQIQAMNKLYPGWNI